MRKYRFKVEGVDRQFWTKCYKAMTYTDALLQMRADFPAGRLLDYDRLDLDEAESA